MVEIRQISSNDSIEELTELLHHAYAPLGRAGLNYTAVDQAPGTTIERINAGCCLVAVEDGRLVGTIVVEPTSRENAECPYFARPGVASAHQMAVAPQCQRRGIGSRLLKAAEAWARTHGFSELALDTAEPARHLVDMYSRRGYRRVDTTQGEGKSYRSVFMSKSLDPERLPLHERPMMATTRKGSCLCGAVSFVVTGNLKPPDACHCVQCRKHSGHYFASTDVPRSALEVTGSENVSWYHSSARVRRGFCSRCGSSLFFDPPARDWIGVAMGAFDTPTSTQLGMHIFVSEKGDYYDIADGLPQNPR